MLVSDAIRRIRSAMHDITEEYTDVECVNYLNEAAHKIASVLIASASPFVVQTVTLHTGDTLPEGFFRTCGSYPIRVTGSTVELLTDADSLAVRYFSMPSAVTAMKEDETMPFAQEPLNEECVRLAVIYAANENEFDATQDAAIVQSIQAAVGQGLG